MKIERKSLLEQIKNVLKDEFIANVEMSNETLTLQFFNGQKFVIEIKEG